MLFITFGAVFCDERIPDSRSWFIDHKKPEWFETDFAKRVIKEIDKAEVLFEEALKDRWGHGISTMCLSTGTKTLLNIYFTPGQIFNGSQMGDNCIPFLMEIARERDVKICLEHYMDIQEEDLKWVRVDGEPVTMEDYMYGYENWCEWVDTESFEYYERTANGEHIIPVKPDLRKMIQEMEE